jgi:hypothetical protein
MLSSLLRPENKTFGIAYQLSCSSSPDHRPLLDVARPPDAGTRHLLHMSFANYAAGAIMMPYGTFLAAAERFRYSIDRLCAEFGANVEQVAHRFTTLAAIAARKAALEAAELERKLATERLDLTLPAPPAPQGSVHPVSQVMDELAEIFADLGFAVATGPEIEDDWHNFTALNIPESHPARAMHDTFYFERAREGPSAMLLRTHTSPVQIRTMMSRSRRSASSRRAGLPLRQRRHPHADVPPGRGAGDRPRHHLGHLKWTLETFLKAFSSATTSCCACARATSLHRAVGRGRRRLVDGEGPPRARRQRRLDGVLGSGMVHPR